MSNKVVPQVYRTVIDKVINSVRPDFEENGIEDAVLVALQQTWEARLASSRVADFTSDPRLGAYQRMLPPLAVPDKTLSPQQDQSQQQQHQQASGSGSTGEEAASSATASQLQQQQQASSSSSSATPAAGLSGSPLGANPEIKKEGDDFIEAKQENGKSKRPAVNPDSNELNSDLDESDEDLLSDEETGDNEDGLNALNGVGDGDVIVAVYEKVQRVKNKWKITLKDGVISADGKDYLFGKCQGDFEW